MILGNCTALEAISPSVKWGAWALRVKVRFLWLRKAGFLVRHTYPSDARWILKSKSTVCLSPVPPMGGLRVSNNAQFRRVLSARKGLLARVMWSLQLTVGALSTLGHIMCW